MNIDVDVIIVAVFLLTTLIKIKEPVILFKNKGSKFK